MDGVLPLDRELVTLVRLDVYTAYDPEEGIPADVKVYDFPAKLIVLGNATALLPPFLIVT